jgi:hypothetical protein
VTFTEVVVREVDAWRAIVRKRSPKRCWLRIEPVGTSKNLDEHVSVTSAPEPANKGRNVVIFHNLTSSGETARARFAGWDFFNAPRAYELDVYDTYAYLASVDDELAILRELNERLTLVVEVERRPGR